MGSYVRLMSEHAPWLEHFITISDIRGFLRSPDGWPEHYQHGWTTHQRASLTVKCEQILASPRWPQLAAQGLQSDDDTVFWAAERAAAVLGIDTFNAHWRRLQASPVTGNWRAIMRQANNERISQIIELATQSLNPDAWATGPSDALGIGTEHAADNALAFTLQDLGRFPGQGWNLVAAGLRNPVVRVRNMAVRTLGGWPASHWPPESSPGPDRCATRRASSKTRHAMTEVLAEAVITTAGGNPQA